MQQSSAPAQAPAAPTPPAAPTGVQIPGENGQPVVFSFTEVPAPKTKADYATLLHRKSQLSDQLRSARERRDAVVRDLHRAVGETERSGLEGRLRVLDGRLAQLELDIAANGRALAAAPAAIVVDEAYQGVEPDGKFGPLSSGQITAVSIVFTLSVLMPLALAFARGFLRRASVPKPPPQVLESAARLERMEQAVDAIAVEVERISEGQRFVTQLMAKQRDAMPAIGARGAGAQHNAPAAPEAARASGTPETSGATIEGLRAAVP